METQIRKPAAGLAGMLWVGVVWAQTGDQNALVDYRLDRNLSGAPAFHLPLAKQFALTGSTNSVGILLFQPKPEQVVRYAYAGVRDSSGEWLDAANLGPGEIATGGMARQDRRDENRSELRVSGKSYYSRDNYSRRWFVMPTENVVLQFTRGHLSNLDQLESPKNIQRTTLSATYNRKLDFGVWQTIFAWGRHSSSISPNVTGYLAESSLQFGRSHTFFGRMEQVRSEDLLPSNDSPDIFKLNKLTAGYFYAVPTGSNSKVDLGGMISRYSVPSSMAPSYGRNPTTVLFFMRMQLQ